MSYSDGRSIDGDDIGLSGEKGMGREESNRHNH